MFAAPTITDDPSLSPPAPRILLVEDDEEARTALKALLEEEGYHVDIASNGTEGVRLARATLPDAIVMDLVLPELNGLDAAIALRRETLTAAIPLIAVTASWLGSAVDRLRAIGFDGALRKPFSPSDLLNELGRHLMA